MPAPSIYLVGLKASAVPDYQIENDQVGTDSNGKPIVRQRVTAPDTNALLEETMLELRNLGDGNAGQMPDASGRTRVSLDAIATGLTLGTVSTVTTVTTVTTVSTVSAVTNTQQADGFRLALDQFYAGISAEAALRSRIAVS